MGKTATAALAALTLLIALAAAATQSLLAPFSDPPGVHTGTNSAGAEGPMQFEPATSAVAHQPPPGPQQHRPRPTTPATRSTPPPSLCTNGAHDNHDLDAALYAYNHAQWYVAEVLAQAATYTSSTTFADTAPIPAALGAINRAQGQPGLLEQGGRRLRRHQGTPRPRPYRRPRPRPAPRPARGHRHPQHRAQRCGEGQGRGRTATLRFPRPLTLPSTTAVTPCRIPVGTRLTGIRVFSLTPVESQKAQGSAHFPTKAVRQSRQHISVAFSETARKFPDFIVVAFGSFADHGTQSLPRFNLDKHVSQPEIVFDFTIR